MGTHVVNVENGTECLPLLIKCSTKERSLVSEVDKAIRLSIRIVIWILPSDTSLFGDDLSCICFDHPNRETAMLSCAPVQNSFRRTVSTFDTVESTRIEPFLAENRVILD